ncbi:methyltransferase family protein [Murinocardiopsis flavida]|uniref:Methyltransferase family protein n=1 Tax=Murinocardiopsis flavida TaxID=645275 RepID=A0A2P8DUL0_9ACTN|nr:class I SAM-dependent methyltransferase [Murinocardiopsis flavida]PSL00918.1 methyltransferase family protein [Murinocardiopsis flavida]
MLGNDDDGDKPDSDVRSWVDRQAAQAAAFDDIGERYDEAFPAKEGQLAAVEPLICGLPPGSSVLDIGCGTGVPTMRRLTEAGLRVTGTDISPVMLELARSNAPKAELVEADMVDLDPDTGQYDAVVAFFSVLMLPRDRIPETLARIRRALVPGGMFCVSMVEADVDDTPIPFLGNDIHVTGYLRDELRTLLTSAGFSIEVENAVVYAPNSTQAYPEVQLFVTCRRVD